MKLETKEKMERGNIRRWNEKNKICKNYGGMRHAMK